MHRLQYLATALAVLLSVTAPAKAQTDPARPVTLIVPAAPGGTADFTARLLADGLTKAMNVQFLVENKSGASGNLGNTAVARAAPDGHTLLISYSGFQVTNPTLYQNLAWDPLKSYAPVALAIVAPHVVLTRKNLPVRTLTEFVAFAKAQPGKVNYASSGLGSIQNIGAEQLSLLTGIKMVHVPYRGAGPAMNDLIAGTVDLFITTPPSAVGHIQAGTVNALAMASKTRHPMLPNVPTSAEAGVAGFELDAWFAVYAPAGTPAAIVTRLAGEIEKNRQEREFPRARRGRRRLRHFHGPRRTRPLHRHRTRILVRRHPQGQHHRRAAVTAAQTTTAGYLPAVAMSIAGSCSRISGRGGSRTHRYRPWVGQQSGGASARTG
jgi:tripartite-type tricarboxylate transporter receptor subunit TctC